MPRRFGIGEWYGRLYSSLTRTERLEIAEAASSGYVDCPFRKSVLRDTAKCTKSGGVCSLRLYEQLDDGSASIVSGPEGKLRALCPSRFGEDHVVNQWVGSVLLGTDKPLVVGEVGFLRSVAVRPNEEQNVDSENVGRIDSVLVHPDMSHLQWCALEIQAVYFSGGEMGSDIKAASTWPADSTPFPLKNRRPDYRSSGPKRLMPQLQIKVPTLRRWGKKMAVVIDESFYDNLAPMDDVADPSNADICWFVVRLCEQDKIATLKPGFVRFTTLERAVEGLTAGRPVTLSEFEKRIMGKLVENR